MGIAMQEQQDDDGTWAGVLETWNREMEPRPRMVRMGDGVANPVDRLLRCGNEQVPAVAALAFQVLSARLDSALANVEISHASSASK